MTTTQNMHALVLHAVGDARFEDIPKPAPNDNEVLVRIGFCGVCGSDIPRTFVKGTYSFPTVCGHEFAGTIEQVGATVAESGEWKVGDRVAVFPLLWCGKCPACEQGQYVMCYDYDYLGSRSDGAFADYVVAPTTNLMRVPDNVSLEEAAMTEPAAVALHAVKRGTPAGGLIGKTIALFGAGPIGLMVAQWCKAMGAGRVLIFDIRTESLAMAKSLGFNEVFNSMEHDAVRKINELTADQGAHIAIDGAGVPITLQQALTVTRRGGKCVVLGNPSGDVTLSATLISQLMRREVDIVGTWNSDYSATGNDDDWRIVLAAMADGTLNLKPLITHKVSLDKGFDALKMMRDQSEFFAKVLIEPGQ